MNKQFLINEINNLVAAHKLWSGIDSHIFALSQGNIWETEYSHAYLYHEQLVFRLILASRKENKEYDENEFSNFQEFIYDLSHNDIPIALHYEIDEAPGYEVKYISTAEELLDLFLQV